MAKRPQRAPSIQSAANKAAPKSTTPNVGFVRPEIAQLRPQYDMIRDALAGEQAVKAQREKYLPMPNADDTSPENRARYDAYITRANFVNFTKRTMSGLIGQVFMRDPVVEIPQQLDVLKDDMTGSGITLDQVAGMLVYKNLAYGRIGLFIDYPDTDAPATVAAIQAGKVRPAILMFDPWTIINWRTVVVDGRELLSLVVIYENVPDGDDGFETVYKDQWRVLSLKPASGGLEDGSADLTSTHLYQVDIWERTSEGYVATQTYMPKDAKGNRLNEIPFKFVGAHNNDVNPDDPPMYDLASVNMAHYRNSADYEEACYIVGQPTPYFTGLTEDWVKNVLKDKVVLGARSAIPLPVGSQAGLLQVSSNGLVKEAMEMKERQMVALGARLIQQAQIQRTATEANQDEANQNSVLANVAGNVELGVKFALTWCARFMGVEIAIEGDKAIKYELNTQFDLTALDPQELAQLIICWQDGALLTTEFRAALRRAGFAVWDDKGFIAQKAKEATDGSAPPPKLLASPKPSGSPGDKTQNTVA